MPTETPYLKLTKPDIEGSADVWGNLLNTDLDKLDVEAQAVHNTAGAALYRGRPLPTPDTETEEQKRTASLPLLYADSVTVPDDRNGVLISAGWFRRWFNQMIPNGMIMIWYGDYSTIPSHWAYCNGQVVNGYVTPNLVNRFVMMAGGGYYPGYAHGTATFTHAGRVDPYAINWWQMPKHSHALNDPGHLHGTKYNDNPSGNGLAASGPYAGNIAVRQSGGELTERGYTAITMGIAGDDQAHDHSFSMSKPWYEFYPPFYALCYIMKVWNV